jgi:ribosomal RNA-processing protein 12
MASASTHDELLVLLLLSLQVCAMRMPVDMLMIWLPQILEGMLIWADDSKNKFRLKVRQMQQPECVDI